ncbi:hypothetical protein PVAND_011171 [Polypedilum vanderplanki]|uniref:E3 ubiquitin-protein ligase listerin n=1 Tax=Polypedilum vanderplanki TaxID=319348 RepID=A0A9J6CHS2_POLVA|nr:hypothetical protein PVAND_011171 [Polypedilum vanderplanki]
MGGKPKPSQRTKGNLKAAKSSNYNVEPLDTSNLLGFGTINSGLLQSSLVGFGLDDSNLPEFDAGVSENFQIVLRKMSKKDPTTKIKALKEFIDLVNESEEQVVLTCLQMYSRLYVSLSTDIDARVRESAQSSLLAVVNKIGKHLATILKQIFPAWICSQHDTNSIAASIANNSFSKAFPKKVSEVFAFCETEILESFIKNITILNAQTICNVKTYSTEECEEKYERVVIATLRGYATYLHKIPKDKIEKSCEKNLMLVGHDRFWSLHKNKSVYVRSAFFEALSSILKNAPFLLKNNEARATSIIFKTLEETEPTTLSHIWTCILLTQINIENWSSHIDIGKVFLPKLWKILKCATYPSIIYPNLLPLISKFNTTIMPDDQLQNFYEKFFENLNYGLRNVQLAKSDLIAVASAYFEVLQYTMVQLTNNTELTDEEKLAKCNRLFDDQIIAVIFWCINNDNNSITKAVFSKIALVIKHLIKNSSTNEIYRQVLERFWNELYEVLKGSIESSNNLQHITNGHLELIKNLKSNSHVITAKSVKIKMEKDEEIQYNDSAVTVLTEKIQNISFDDSLNSLVEKLCALYVQKINETLEMSLIENLEILIKDYQSKELFKHIASDQEDQNICSLYDTFAKWLQNDDLRCEAIVEIILVLYKYLETSEKIDLLNRWIQIPSVQKNWLIMRALSYPLCCDAGITKFLKMKEVTNHLAECAKLVVDGHYKDNLVILQKCFFQTENGDILIDVDTCRNIVNIISKAFHDDTKINQLDQCGSFLAQIFSTICSDPNKKDIQLNIFLSLFNFSLNREISDDVSEDTMWEISTAWQDALSSGDIVMDNELLKMCSEIFHEKISYITISTIEIDKVERLSQLISKLILCSNEDKHGQEKNSYTNKMIEQLLKFENQYNIYVQDLSSSIKLLHGEMTFTKTSVSHFNDIKFNEALDSYLKQKIFQLNVILMLSCSVKKKAQFDASTQKDDESDNDNDEIEFSELNKQSSPDEEVTEDYCDLNESLIKEYSGVILDTFIEVCYSEAILSSLLMNLKTLDKNLENWIIYMQERLTMLIENVPENIQNEVKEKLFELANSKGEFYANCLNNLLHIKEYNKENGKILLFEDCIAKAKDDVDNFYSHVNILQTFDEILDKRSMPVTSNLFEKSKDFLLKVSALRSLMKNHLNVGDFNDMEDRKVIGHALSLLHEIIIANKEDSFLLYNKDISNEESKDVLTIAVIAHFISDCLKFFPTEIDVKRWDFIRIALSSWTLSVSKSSQKFTDEKVKAFIIAIFKLNASLQKFITLEKTKSSTQMLTNVIDEWENVSIF